MRPRALRHAGTDADSLKEEELNYWKTKTYMLYMLSIAFSLIADY